MTTSNCANMSSRDAAHMAPQLGDMIESQSEAGIVCHLDPPIMRLIEFKSYVIYDPYACVTLRVGAEPDVTPPKQDLVQRIRAYIAQNTPDASPTGG